MNCKKCGYLLTENDQFCKNCGASVNEMNAQNMNSVSSSIGGQVVNDIFGPAQQPMVQSVQQPAMDSTQQPMVQSVQQPAMDSTQQPMNNQVQQPMMNSMQQPTGENNYSQNVQMPSQKNSSVKFVVLGGVLVVAVFVAVFFGTKFFAEDNKTTEDNKVADSSNTVSTYKVNFKGFTFKIPTDLVYEAQSDIINLGDEDGIWVASLEVVEGSYNQLLSRKGQLQSIYQNAGYTSSAAIEKTIGGMSFITLELAKSGSNVLLGFAKANSMYIFGVTAYNMDNEYDYGLLEKVSKVLSSAEYTGETNNMQFGGKIDMSSISELAK